MSQQNNPTEFTARLTAALNLRRIQADDRAAWVSKTMRMGHDGLVSDVLSGKVRPSFELTERLAKALGVEHEWLRHGVGPVISRTPDAELADPLVLCYVPASSIPAGAKLAGGERVVSYEDYLTLALRYADAEARLKETA